MARKKKDGRFINYYIDRVIFERLEHYASERGQQMTTAIERILKEYLDRCDAECTQKRVMQMYCPDCNILIHTSCCPACGNRNVRHPHGDDFCFLAEKELIWAGALEDILKQNGICCVTRNVLGAGLAAKMGHAQERTRFYVPYADYTSAKELEQQFFSAKLFDSDFESEFDAERQHSEGTMI